MNGVKRSCRGVEVTLVSRDEWDIFGRRGHTEDLVAVDLALYFSQVAKGAGDAC